MSIKKGLKFYKTLNIKDQRNDAALTNVYQDWAKDYDKDNDNLLGTVSQPLAVKLLSEFAKKRDLSIIDVGCGTGIVGKELHKIGFSKFDGVDISREMLKTAKTRGYSNLLIGSLNEKLPIKENTYDVAFCVGVFTHDHVKSDRLDELIRVIKSGGLICFTINESIYETYGFNTKILKLQSDRKWKILALKKDKYMIKKNVAGFYCLAEVY